MTECKRTTPKEIESRARALEEQYDLDTFIDFVIDPERQRYASVQPDPDFAHDEAMPSEYLQPHQFEAWKILATPKSFRLSDALHLYLKTHQLGAEDAVTKKASRY